MRCKRLTWGCFTLNRRSVYLNLICKNQIIMKPLQSQHASSGTLGFWKPFFRNRRYPLWKRFTVLSKLMYNISERLFNYLQVTGYLFHFIATILNIIIFRRVSSVTLLSIWSMIPNFFSSLIPIFSGYIFFT